MPAQASFLASLPLLAQAGENKAFLLLACVPVALPMRGNFPEHPSVGEREFPSIRSHALAVPCLHLAESHRAKDAQLVSVLVHLSFLH